MPTVAPVAQEASDERDFRRRFGIVLAKMRLKAELTQAEVSEAMGSDVQTISRWENGHRSIRVVEMAKLIRLYNPPAESLPYLFNPPPVPVHDLDGLLGDSATPRRRGPRRKPPGDDTGAARPAVAKHARRRGAAR